MTMTHVSPTPPDTALEDRLRRVMALHFDPDEGSPYWLDRARDLDFNPRRDVSSIENLGRFSPMSIGELHTRPLMDFVPRALHGENDRLVVGQTSGASGPGTWTAYRDDEFDEAFVAPFAAAAGHVGFPRGETWLYAGPTGPHIIGKVVPHLARAVGSVDPFSIDLDPRWVRKLADGSFPRKRYLQHVIDQAMLVINSQPIGVLFTTPPILAALAAAMTERQRLAIRGVHYGGLALTPEERHDYQAQAFPNAVHLSGYGNTLFGCCLELRTDVDGALAYYPFGHRLLFEVVNDANQPVSEGMRGRVVFTRLDETMLIIRALERDSAKLVQPHRHAPPGFTLQGVHCPQPGTISPDDVTPTPARGLY